MICPENIIQPNDPEAYNAKVSWIDPYVADNSGTYEVWTDHISGDSFDIGNTTVTVYVVDGSGNSANCSFLVTVIGTHERIVCFYN